MKISVMGNASLVILALAAALTVNEAARATTIDFTAETTGGKLNGYTIGIASFFSTDTLTGNLDVENWLGQSHGNGLAVFGGVSSKLQINFSSNINGLSLDFGNDDPCCSQSGNLAILQGFRLGTLIAQATVVMNRNDIMDQTISLAGTFDQVFFYYGDSSFAPIFLTEIVDDITFSTVAVPSPIVGGGLPGLIFASGLLGWWRSRRNAVDRHLNAAG